MAGPPPNRDTVDDTGVGPDRGSTTSTPRWVKVFGIIGIVVVLLIVVVMLVGGGGGGHGPSRHAPSGNAAPSSVTEVQVPSGGELGGHTPPSGVPDHGSQ